MNKVIYTIGTSKRSQEEFLSLLQKFGIQAVMDVRRFPTSRFDHFKRETLAQLLQETGVSYIYLGVELGGYRKGGYEKYIGTDEFVQALGCLEEEAAIRVAVIVCSERLPWKCHRRFIGKELEKRGWHVIHIIDEKRTWISVKDLSYQPEAAANF